MSSDELPDAGTVLRGRACGDPHCRCATSLRRGVGKTHCGSHDDPVPSLKVTPDSRLGAKVFCHGGCGKERKVREALHELSLWPDPAERSSGERLEQVETYPYGCLCHGPRTLRKHRLRDPQDPNPDSKSFAWEHLDGKRHRRGYGGHVPDLYLPAPLPEAGVVVVVEGERCANLLREWNLTATSGPNGEGTIWLPEYSKRLAGNYLVLLPDNDSAGEKYIEPIVAAHPPGRSMTLRLGGDHQDDVVDWARRGYTREELISAMGLPGCEVCGNPIAPPRHGFTARFCSHAHQVKGWRKKSSHVSTSCGESRHTTATNGGQPATEVVTPPSESRHTEFDLPQRACIRDGGSDEGATGGAEEGTQRAGPGPPVTSSRTDVAVEEDVAVEVSPPDSEKMTAAFPPGSLGWEAAAWLAHQGHDREGIARVLAVPAWRVPDVGCAGWKSPTTNLMGTRIRSSRAGLKGRRSGDLPGLRR